MQIKSKLIYSIFLLIFIYFLLRLSSLLTITFFPDEAEYLFWAKTIISDPSMYLISLSEGVKPLFVWLQIPFLLLGNGIEIHEARMVSLFSGLFTMLGLYLLSLELFKNKKIGILAVIIFIFFPYAQIYNSVAVFEGTVGTFILFSLLFSIKLVKRPTLLLAVTFGVITGLGILTKRHAFFNLYLLPLSFIFFPFKKSHLKKLAFLCLLVFISILITNGMQQFLKSSEYFERIAWFEGGTLYTKGSWFIMPLSQKLTIFLKNSQVTIPFLISYITIPYIFLLGFSLTLYKKYARQIAILLAYFLIPLLSLLLFGTRSGEHWVYPMTLTLIPLMALGLFTLTEKILHMIRRIYKKTWNIRYGIYALFLLYPTIFIGMIIFNPLSSPLTTSEKKQYFVCPMEMFLNDIPFLTKAAKSNTILIGTENDKGFKNFMAINLWENTNIVVKGYWPKNHELPRELEKTSNKMPVYYATIWYNRNKLSSKTPIKLISEKISPTKSCIYRLYKVD